MLSRIAESLFWIGRYLERAEDTCRILDVNRQLVLDDPSVDSEAAGAALLRVMGAPIPERIDEAATMKALCYDEGSSGSIVSALTGARESARRARETVSIELWESINTTWYSVRDGRLKWMRSADALKLVRERCALIAGIADGTMSHDEGWHFLMLGRSLERTDMTARLLSTVAATSATPSAWRNVLRGCGAYHAFIRTYGGAASNREAAEFLLLDRLFPRSLVHSLTTAEDALSHLDPGERRAGYLDDAQRLVVLARTGLEYRPKGEILQGLPQRMTDLQRVCNDISRSISAKYFEGAIAAEWRGGAW